MRSDRYRFAASLMLILALTSSATVAGGETATLHSTQRGTACATCGNTPCNNAQVEDRFWVISTRHLTFNARCAQLEAPNLAVYRISRNGCITRTTIEDYLASIGQGRRAVIYVHGNRMDPEDAVERGIDIYRHTRRCCPKRALDWVIWSWPSEKEGILLRDARRKFRRIDAQALYLAGLLRHHVHQQVPTTLIGYSFGGRVVTGSMHALAGGSLGGRVLPGEPIRGAGFDAGLVAPAIERPALTERGIHSQATQNLNSLLLLYNRRDAVLKRFWLLDRVRGAMALGYTGPTQFAARFDGSRLPVRARDCAATVGHHHVELDYYSAPCNAGREMATLINDVFNRN